MPRRSEPKGVDGILSRVAAAISRSLTPEEAAEAFASALSDSVPGLSAWVFHLHSESPPSSGAWICGRRDPPFPASVSGDPRSVLRAVVQSPPALELGSGSALRAFPEAPYLKRLGGAWWFLAGSAPVPAGVVVLSHKDGDEIRHHLADILTAAGLLQPHLALISSLRNLERRVGARTSELELFYETSRALALAKTIEDIVSVLAENLSRHIGFDVLGVLALRLERAELYMEATGSPSPSSLRQFRRAMLREISEQLGGKPGGLTVRIGRRSQSLPARMSAGAEPVHIQLSAQGRILGLLSLRPDRSPIEESRMRLLYTLASQAALTLDRVSAVEQAGFMKLQAVLNSMSEGVLLLDRRQRVVLANPAARTLVAEIHGGPFPQKLRRLGRIQTSSLVEVVAAGGAPPPSEIALPGSERFFQVTASPVQGLKGVLEGLVLVVSDVTQQRRLLDQLAQSEKLSSLGVMISGFAHELNNPLASIMGYAQLLAERDLVHDVQKKVTAINAEASRCHRIVENLLRFARKQSSERKLVDLNSVVGSVLQLMGYQLQTDGIIVDVDLDRNMMPLIGDFHALQQVLVNIVHNAQQAMKEKGGGGLLTIVTKCDGRSASAEVTDTGPGISPENLKRIFDPFFSTKRVGQGTGLGLSIAYGTVQDHGGEIQARSRQGVGTTFVLEFPVTQTRVEALEATGTAERVPETVARGKRILVVEDEGSLSEMMCEALAAEGHHVEAAANGVRAREMLRESRYDLIISDIKMPSMGGRELYDTVLRTDPALARRIIFSTGDSVSAETHAFFQKVGNPYLTKPFNLNDLFRIVQRTLRHS